MKLLTPVLLMTLSFVFTGCQTRLTESSFELIEKIARNPNLHKGALISSAAEVVDVRELPDGNALVNVYSAGRRRSFVLITDAKSLPAIKRGSFVRFLGRVSGEIGMTNALGGSTSGITVETIGLITQYGSIYEPAEEGLYQQWRQGALALQ